MSVTKRVVAAGLVLAGLVVAVGGCSSGNGPGAFVGEQAGGAAGRKMTNNGVGEAVGAAAGNAAGDKADDAGKGKH